MEHNTTTSNNKVACCNNCREVYQQAQESRYVTASQPLPGHAVLSWELAHPQLKTLAVQMLIFISYIKEDPQR